MNKYKFLIVTGDQEKQVTVYAEDEAEAKKIADGMAQQLTGDADSDFYVGLMSKDTLSWADFADALKRNTESLRGSACFAGHPEPEGGGADEPQNN